VLVYVPDPSPHKESGPEIKQVGEGFAWNEFNGDAAEEIFGGQFVKGPESALDGNTDNVLFKRRCHRYIKKKVPYHPGLLHYYLAITNQPGFPVK